VSTGHPRLGCQSLVQSVVPQHVFTFRTTVAQCESPWHRMALLVIVAVCTAAAVGAAAAHPDAASVPLSGVGVGEWCLQGFRLWLRGVLTA
jgi:hypothetical protein